MKQRPILVGILWWAGAVLAVAPVAYFFGITRGDLQGLLARLVMYAGDLAVVGIILFAAFGFGGFVLALLRLELGDTLALVYAILTGLGVVALAVLGLGVLGLFALPFFLALLVIGVALAVLRPGSRALLAGFRTSIGEAAWQIHADPLAVVALVAAAGATLYSMLINALVPPFDWDSIAYHLAVPEIYLQSHRIVYLPSIVHSNWPFNLEMLYTLALAIGSDRTPGFLTLSFLILGELALVLAGMKFKSARAGILAAAFYAGLPLVERFAGTARVDIPLAVFAFAAILVGYEGAVSGHAGRLALAGLLAGFAAGSKLTGASTGLVLGTFLVILVLRRRRGRLRWRAVGVFVLAFALVAGPWYLKSWIVTGNPIWPFLANIFPSRNWDAYGTQVFEAYLHSSGTGTSLRSLALLPWNLSLTNRFGSFLGPLFLILVPVAVITTWRRALVWYLVAFSAAATLIWFYLTQQPRFLSPVLLALALLAGIGATRAIEIAPVGGRTLAALALAFWFILEFPLAQETQRAQANASLQYVLGRTSAQAFLEQRIDILPVFEYANAHLPADAYVLLLWYEDRGFYLHRRYFWGNPVSQRVIRFEQIDTADELAGKLRAMGFTDVIIDPHWDLPDMPYAKHFHQLIDAYTARYLQPVYSQGGNTLYHIRGAPAQ